MYLSVRHLFLPLLITFCLTISVRNLRSQGCSDAGACSLPSFKPANPDSLQTDLFRHLIRINTFYGLADNDVNTLSMAVTFQSKLSDGWRMGATLTGLSQFNRLHHSIGFSDVIVNASYQATDGLSFTGGLKLPIHLSNSRKDGQPLPMDFQPGLGTWDMILGFKYQYKRWSFSAAFQQPLTQNENTFIDTLSAQFRDFPSTNRFRRNGDLIVRINYSLPLNSKWKLIPHLLPIYHVANDQFTNPKGEQQTIVGSAGLTLNVILSAEYALNKKDLIRAIVAFPILVRTARPDGLTRSLLIGLEYDLRL